MNASTHNAPLVILVMGVSGAGKTSVGEALARALDARFQDSDAFHPLSNIAKMQAGVPLDDIDRAPWLAAVKSWIDATLAARARGVIACSALRRSYRDALQCARAGMALVHLHGDSEVIRARLETRGGHFLPPQLLDSQIATLERPAPEEAAIVAAIAWPVEKQVEHILLHLSQTRRHQGQTQ